MTISEILKEVKATSGSNDKRKILENNSDNDLLKKVLLYATDPFTSFNIVKVPKTTHRFPAYDESIRWNSFFDIADLCATRAYTGNDAIGLMCDAFSVATESEEMWMRKILKKHLAIGVSIKSINKVFPNLIQTFDVSLAQRFEEKRIIGKEEIAVEPKLDGIRCFAIVKDGEARLFARSGKLILNFNTTIGVELSKLEDGCYDGELMGDDFIALMRQAYRKDNIDTKSTYLALFDYLSESEWTSRNVKMTCRDRYSVLLRRLTKNNVNSDLIRPVDRYYIDPDYSEIMRLHDEFVRNGYEGAMIKDPDAPYKFGRGYEIMKLKAFHDVDLDIQSLEEGTGKYIGKLGSVVVDFNGVDVRVGSGFSDDLREKMWLDPVSFTGRTIEIRYQEITPDGSLRFPTFVCFRNDK